MFEYPTALKTVPSITTNGTEAPMTDTADLVNELTPEQRKLLFREEQWQRNTGNTGVADAIAAAVRAASTLQAELVEVKREIERIHRDVLPDKQACIDHWGRRAETAESALTHARERIAELEAELQRLRNPVSWKLGETAPRDGTVILGRWNGIGEWRVRYDRGWFYADGEQSECPQPVWWRHETALAGKVE